MEIASVAATRNAIPENLFWKGIFIIQIVDYHVIRSIENYHPIEDTGISPRWNCMGCGRPASWEIGISKFYNLPFFHGHVNMAVKINPGSDGEYSHGYYGDESIRFLDVDESQTLIAFENDLKLIISIVSIHRPYSWKQTAKDLY